MAIRLLALVGAVIVVGAVIIWLWAGNTAPEVPNTVRTPLLALRPVGIAPTREQTLRQRLYAELQPVRLSNCELERFGETNDGGYLMCGNLLGDVAAAYSYGIANYDGWGCRVSRDLGVRVHQYDCFDQRRPACPDGDTRFHPECIAPQPFTDAEGRRFDSLARQVARNGDARRRLVVKIDVEGAEWDSLLQTPSSVLERIDQLAMEFHGVANETWKFYLVVSKLKDHFHVAHLHFNNQACRPGLEPFPGYAYEVLLVNKRLGVLAPDQSEVTRPHPLDTPSNPGLPDCQYVSSAGDAR